MRVMKNNKMKTVTVIGNEWVWKHEKQPIDEYPVWPD